MSKEKLIELNKEYKVYKKCYFGFLFKHNKVFILFNMFFTPILFSYLVFSIQSFFNLGMLSFFITLTYIGLIFPFVLFFIITIYISWYSAFKFLVLKNEMANLKTFKKHQEYLDFLMDKRKCAIFLLQNEYNVSKIF